MAAEIGTHAATALAAAGKAEASQPVRDCRLAGQQAKAKGSGHRPTGGGAPGIHLCALNPLALTLEICRRLAR